MIEKVLVEQLGNVLYCDYISKIKMISNISSYGLDGFSPSMTIKCIVDDTLTETGRAAISEPGEYDYYIVRRKRE